MSLIAPALVIQELEGIINFADGDSNTRFGGNSSGAVFTLDRVQKNIDRAESIVLQHLSQQYCIPLTSSVNGGTTLDDFIQSTRGSIESLILDNSCIRIISYGFAQQGNAREVKNILTVMRERYQENLKLSLVKDGSGGFKYPAFEDVVLSDNYISRQDNIIPSVSNGERIKDYNSISILRNI